MKGINIPRLSVVLSRSGMTAGLFAILLLAGCATTGSVTGSSDTAISAGAVDYPDWVMTPPDEDGYFFGIGSDADLGEARQKAIVDTGRQVSVRARRVFEESSSVSSSDVDAMVRILDEQVTDVEVVGAKFADQYQDGEGSYWVLTRAPQSCILDATESVLMSYSLNVETELPDIREVIRGVVDDVGKELAAPTDWMVTASRRVPWTPRVSDDLMKVDGNPDDWGNVPVYYRGRRGDARVEGTDLDYIKSAMDSERAYVLLACVDARWKTGVTFEINFDYADGTRYSPTSATESDIHTNFHADNLRFWDQGSDWEQGYDPGVKIRRSGAFVEMSIPLERYEADRFNVVYVNVWEQPANRVADSTTFDYRSTWIDEMDARRRRLVPIGR